MKQPFFSIIIPSFNQVQFIKNCLEPILLSKRKVDIEIIIVDNISTDGTVEYLNDIRNEIDVLIIEKDDGQSHAINKGYEVANGKFIIWQNSDDYFLNESLELLKEKIEKNPGFDIYYGNSLILFEEENSVINHFFQIVTKENWKYLGLLCNNQSAALRSEKLRSMNKRKLVQTDLHYAMDRELFYRLAQEGCKYFYINKFISVFRYQRQSKSGSKDSAEKWDKELSRVYKSLNIKKSIVYKMMYLWYKLIKYLFHIYNSGVLKTYYAFKKRSI